MAITIPLEGLYLHLVRGGFPLSVRDYQDAVIALRRGYGGPRREDLRWLCEALWARTDQEVSRLDRLFREFPWPSADALRDVVGEPGRPETRRKGRAGSTRRPSGASETTEQPAPAIEFVAPSESGVGLPHAITPERAGEVFIFTPRPLLSLRSLIIGWRRFRIAQRSGPKVELDLEATVADQSRRGILVEPVMVAARRNQARLLILVDASPSMATWRHMNRLIAESLQKSQLAHAAIYYFDGAPVDDVYQLETLSRPVGIAQTLKDHPRCALLVVSDAGAATGRLDRERVHQVRGFVGMVRSVWQPVAWLNPMPRLRWRGTTADAIARLKGMSMFEFTDDGLIQAVDYLRGKRNQ